MSEFTDTTLGEVLTLQRGFDLPGTERSSGPFPVIASTGQVGTHIEAMVRGPGVVIGRSGSLGGGQFIKSDFWPLNTTLWVKDFKGNNIRFCYYLLKSLDLKTFNVGSGVPTLNRNHVHMIPVRVPASVYEQGVIAHILGTLDDKIELNRRMNETLEAMARAIFKSWFVDFDPVRAKAEGLDTGLPKEIADLFPDSFEETELGEVPKGWRIGTIKDCCSQISNGGTPKRSESQYWEGGTVPWLTSGEVRQSIVTRTENFITEKGLDESSAKWIPAKSTLVALYGATAGQVSFNSFSLTTNQAVCALIPKKNYVYYNYLMMLSNISELENKASGSAQQNISKRTVEDTSIVIPSLSILEKFTKQVEPLFNLWESNLINNYKLVELRDTLLPELISGDLRINHGV
jgi:Restriction endonuclease S subunits